MKIEKVIFTIDDNPHYKGFWASISNHYKNRMGITPVLHVISNREINEITDYDTTNGEIKIIKALPNIPTIIQALIGKFYFTIMEPDTTWKIGDLDLYPLQQYHFKDRINEISDDAYVHLNPHAYTENWRNDIYGLAGYFHVAKGSVFESELQFKNKSFQEVCLEIFNSNKFGIKFYSHLHASYESQLASNDSGWFCCEEMYTGFLLRESKKLIELPPVDKIYRRVDRSQMIYDDNNISSGYYIDFHSPRPYGNYKEIIESIVSKIPLK